MDETTQDSPRNDRLCGDEDIAGRASMLNREADRWEASRYLEIIDSNIQTFDIYGAHHGGKGMKIMEIIYMRKHYSEETLI